MAQKAGGKKESTLLAVDILHQEGYVSSERGRSGHPVYTSLKPYRAADDPQADWKFNLGNALQPT